ncbi:MAG: class I SAM-dependent methyltransferase [Phycisphaerales bacterium]|nr:MAG: class I SAM-dependent methyltransferase [Phycisphaerales bacterium]
MRLSKRILQRLDANLVCRINEIYHNLENVRYDEQHEDISKFELRFWRDVAQKYSREGKPSIWLDYGAGTGFVSSVVGEHLQEDDLLVCCDVSSEMLKICEAKLRNRSPRCRLSFRKNDSTLIPADNDSVDVISVNSVLHHIFDLRDFAAECERVLKPSGLFIVAHEPNKNTKLAFPGGFVRSLARIVFRPKAILFWVAEQSPLSERLMRWITGKVSDKYRRRNRMLADVARQVRQEHLLDFDIRGTEIQQIVDFHSQYGFDRNELCGHIFRRFEVVEFDTYGHLGFYPESKSAIAVERYLRKRWPDAGKEICFVLRLTKKEITGDAEL